MSPFAFLIPISIKEKIRIGNKHDGGYVVYEKLLDKTDVLISYGIGWDTAFEEHFHRLTGKKVLMFDPTMFRGRFLPNFRYLMGSVAPFKFKRSASYLSKIILWWYKRNWRSRQELYFINEGIAPEQKPHYNTLANHIERYGLTDKNILLKIDIEGDEFDVFENEMIFSALKNINQIIIEWHDLKTRLHELRTILSRFKNEFEIVHVHGNNWGDSFTVPASSYDEMKKIYLPDVLEMTLVRRENIHSADLLKEQEKYPVSGLDWPNNPRKPDMPLDFISRLFETVKKDKSLATEERKEP